MCDDAACGGSSGIKDQLACVGGGAEVSSSISNARREGVAAVGGEVGVGSEDPAAIFNGGIAEEGCTGIDAEGVSGAEVAAKAAREGGSEVVGASTIVEVSLDEPDVVGDACDPAAGVGRHPVNHQVRIAAKGPCSSWFSKGEDGCIASGIVDGAAIECECY